VIRFTPDERPAWVGNFARGLTSLDHVCEHLNGGGVLVVAGGNGYVIDPDTRAQLEEFGGQIEDVIPVPELGLLVFGNGVWFEVLDRNGLRWATPRISWDGMRDVRREGLRLLGEAWYPMAEGYWVPFEVDLATGQCTGGSYDGPS